MGGLELAGLVIVAILVLGLLAAVALRDSRRIRIGLYVERERFGDDNQADEPDRKTR